MGKMQSDKKNISEEERKQDCRCGLARPCNLIGGKSYLERFKHESPVASHGVIVVIQLYADTIMLST